VGGVTDEHLRILGHIALEFGHLEWLVGLGLEAVLGSQDVARITTGDDSLSRRLTKLVKLTKAKFPDLAEAMEAWVRETKALAEKRNRILHSAWARLGERSDSLVLIGGREELFQLLPLEVLREIPDQIRRCTDQGRAVIRRLLTSTPQ